MGRRKNGTIILVDSSPKLADWRSKVHDAAVNWMDRRPWFESLDCAVCLYVVFTFRRPASAPRRKRPYMTTFPDATKLGRAVEDSLVTSGLLTDDKLVVDTHYRKVYLGEDRESLSRPGAYIMVTPVLIEPIVVDNFIDRTLALDSVGSAGSIEGSEAE
jgi:Holliday junction resolvase RusA-like endonuclease